MDSAEPVHHYLDELLYNLSQGTLPDLASFLSGIPENEFESKVRDELRLLIDLSEIDSQSTPEYESRPSLPKTDEYHLIAPSNLLKNLDRQKVNGKNKRKEVLSEYETVLKTRENFKFLTQISNNLGAENENVEIAPIGQVDSENKILKTVNSSSKKIDNYDFIQHVRQNILTTQHAHVQTEPNIAVQKGPKVERNPVLSLQSGPEIVIESSVLANKAVNTCTAGSILALQDTKVYQQDFGVQIGILTQNTGTDPQSLTMDTESVTVNTNQEDSVTTIHSLSENTTDISSAHACIKETQTSFATSKDSNPQSYSNPSVSEHLPSASIDKTSILDDTSSSRILMHDELNFNFNNFNLTEYSLGEVIDGKSQICIDDAYDDMGEIGNLIN